MVTLFFEPIPGISFLEIRQIQQADNIAIGKFIKIVEPIISRIADGYAPQNTYQHDELVQEGRLSAIEAAKQWCPDRGCLEPYVNRSIRNGILYHCRKQRQQYRHEVTESSIMGNYEAQESMLDRVDVDGGYAEIDRQDALPVLRKTVCSWMGSLSSQKQRVIDLVFYKGLNQSQAAEEMGITRARVGQVVQEIISQGKKTLAEIAHLN